MRGLPFVLLVLLLAACGGGSSEQPSSHDDGLTHYQISAGNFSIGVPETWHATTATEMRKASFKRFAHENPVFARYAGAAAKKNSPFKFFAFDPVVRKRFVTNLNVVIAPAGKRLTPEKYRRSAIAEAKSIAVSRLDASDVTLPAGKALRLFYRARFVVGGKKRTISTLQYAFLRDGESFVLTYTTLPAFATQYEGMFRRSAASLRLS